MKRGDLIYWRDDSPGKLFCLSRIGDPSTTCNAPGHFVEFGWSLEAVAVGTVTSRNRFTVSLWLGYFKGPQENLVRPLLLVIRSDEQVVQS